MFGSVGEWFHKHLAGLDMADDAIGYDKAIITPKVGLPSQTTIHPDTQPTGRCSAVALSAMLSQKKKGFGFQTLSALLAANIDEL